MWKSLYKLLMIEMTSSGIWWYFNTDSVKLWWTSPKAFCRSIKLMIAERCLRCLPRVNPFCIEVSIYLLLCKNLTTLSLNNDVKISITTGSTIIGLKFERSSLSTFLYIKMVADRCPDFGIDFFLREPPYKFQEQNFENWSIFWNIWWRFDKEDKVNPKFLFFWLFCIFCFTSEEKGRCHRWIIEFRYPVSYSKQLSGINCS